LSKQLLFCVVFLCVYNGVIFTVHPTISAALWYQQFFRILQPKHVLLNYVYQSAVNLSYIISKKGYGC